jgi:hypothetical protein
VLIGEGVHKLEQIVEIELGQVIIAGLIVSENLL